MNRNIRTTQIGVPLKMIHKWLAKAETLYQKTPRSGALQPMAGRVQHLANLREQVQPAYEQPEQTISYASITETNQVLVTVKRWFHYYDLAMSITVFCHVDHLPFVLERVDSIFRAYNNGAVIVLPNFNPALETWSMDCDLQSLIALSNQSHLAALLAIKQGSYHV